MQTFAKKKVSEIHISFFSPLNERQELLNQVKNLVIFLFFLEAFNPFHGCENQLKTLFLVTIFTNGIFFSAVKVQLFFDNCFYYAEKQKPPVLDFFYSTNINTAISRY